MVRDLLERESSVHGTPFTCPPFLVLFENNYAYGAATYMQMLWFLDDLQRRRHHKRHEPVVDVVFATPLYGMDPRLVALYATLASHEEALAAEKKQPSHTCDTVYNITP